MDSEEFRAIMSRSRVGIWALIEAAIKVASSDYGDELARRRDKIVELLYAPEAHLCRNCNGDIASDVVEHEPYFPEIIANNYNTSENIDNSKYDEDDDESKKTNIDSNGNRISNESFSKSQLTPESDNRNSSGGEEEDVDPYAGLFDDDQAKILAIKEQLEDPNQSEDAVVELLHNLGDMDIEFQALKETDIGRHVNRLRKHSSNEVRGLVKHLVIKWKDTVDEWVKMHQPQPTSKLNVDGDSPQKNIPKNQQNGHHQVPDFGYSQNPQSGSSSIERKYVEHESKPKQPQSATRRESLSKPPHSVPKSTSALPNASADYHRNGILPRATQRESAMDDEKLNSARKRLQENYQEAQNAKKQRTIQVMDIHDIPKQKNVFFAKNKGSFQGRSHR